MPTEIIMPKVDMVMETGTFVEWLKKEGQQVQKGEPLFIILTDKATIECEAPATGILGGINASPDDVIPVTNVIGYILSPGESLPLNVVPTRTLGIVEEFAQNTNHKQAPVMVASKATVEKSGADQQLLRATPLARTVARELGLDLSMINGKGPRGRVYKSDVLAAVEAAKSIPVAVPLKAATVDTIVPSLDLPAEETAKSNPLNSFPVVSASSIALPNARERERIPVKGIRSIVARRLAYSASTVPHIFLSINVDMSEIVRMKQLVSPSMEARLNIRLSYTAIIAYVIARLLPNHPYMNSSWVDSEIILWQDVNLGIATALEDNLVVPVVRNAQQLSLEEMVKEMSRLLEGARGHKLAPSELSGSTFTISNLGMYGIEDFTTIINPPEAAILAVAKMVNTPVVIDNSVTIRPIIHFTLGTDHRINDGLRAARFLNGLKDVLENPCLLF